MKVKHLLTLTLAGMLIFGNATLVANATSITTQGTIVDGPNANAGDTLNVQADGINAPDADAPDAADSEGEDPQSFVQSQDGDVPLSSQEVEDGDVPLASKDVEPEKSSSPKAVVAVVGGVAAVGIAAIVFLTAAAKVSAGAGAAAAGTAGAKGGLSWLKALFKRRRK